MNRAINRSADNVLPTRLIFLYTEKEVALASAGLSRRIVRNETVKNEMILNISLAFCMRHLLLNCITEISRNSPEVSPEYSMCELPLTFFYFRRLSGAKLRDWRSSGFTDFQKAYVSFFGCSSNDRLTKTQPDVTVDRRDDETEPRESPENTSEITAVIFDNEEKENGRTVRANRRNKKFNVTIAMKTSRRRAVNEKCEKTVVADAPKSRLKPNGTIKKDDTETVISKSKIKRSSNGPYTCDLCGKKFRLRDSLKTHARIHTGEKQYTCHICGKQFAQTGCLYYHLKHVHAGVKNHSCDICGRSFAMKTTMEDHRRSIHTGERPFVCDSCGKTFKTKSSLYIHSRIHTEMYPHECKYCKKVFRWRQQLLGHLTIHTGEKNHSCDVCGKAFGVKNHLTRHKRTHSAEKPYACQQCGMSFGQKRYLTTHERLKHR